MTALNAWTRITSVTTPIALVCDINPDTVPVTKSILWSDIIKSITGPVLFASDDGINFDTTAGGDSDIDILTLNVTGTPRLWWDESTDAFVLSKPIAMSDATGIVASDACFFTARAVDGATSANAHCFGDYSTITRSADIGYNSFNCNITVGGTANYDHFAAFQQAGSYGTSGTIGKVYGVYYAPTIAAGCTVTNAYGCYIAASIGDGTVTNDYGIYLATGIKGGTLNYAIYSAGSAPSFHKGNVGIGIAPQTDKIFFVSGASTTGSVNNTGISIEQTYTGTYTTGLNVQCASAGSSGITGIFGIYMRPNHGSSGTLASYYGLYSALTSDGGTITNLYHMYVANATGTVTNQYGIYVAELTQGGTADYAIYTAGATPSLFTGVVTVGGLVMADATNIVLNTTTGTKIGTAITQKLGFFNVTPIVQPTVATDATVGTLITSLTLLGLIKNA